MATLVFSPGSNQDEGFYSAQSDGSISPSSFDSGSQSPSSPKNIEVADNQLIMLAEATQPGLFSEQGHMAYIPCMYCTLIYNKEPSTSLPKFAVKHKNHIYINHWIFLRCGQCNGDSLENSLKGLTCRPKDNTCDVPCPLENLKTTAKEYIMHDKICSGGSSCSNLTLKPERYSCCNSIAFGETTFKIRVPRVNVKERLTDLPQVECPAKIHIKHNCVVDPCVDQRQLQEALQKADCLLTGEFNHGACTIIYKAFSNSNEALVVKAACLHHYSNNVVCHSVDTEIFISKLLNPDDSTPVLFHYGAFRLRDTVFMVSKQYVNGNLAVYLNHVGNLGEENYRSMMDTLCRGIHFLHSHCIAHRNLTIDNILVGETPSDLKIAGLGSSCVVQPDQLISYPYVSYLYAAPEFFQTRPFDPLKPDIWSLGVVMFYLFIRQQLFPNSSISHPQERALGVNWNFSMQSKSFLESQLTREYKSRPNIDKVQEHPWLHLH